MTYRLLFAAALLSLSGAAFAKTPDIARLLNHPDRPATDKARDSQRKPADIVTLLDLQPGMTVIDYAAGRGYYTEIFARALDRQGLLYSVKGRLSERALKNFDNLKVTADLYLEDIDARVDRIFTALNYHDLINRQGLDRRKLLANMHDKLADDGYLVVIDHNAAPGRQTADTKSKHRVESTFVLKEILAAGFELDRSLSILANPADDYSLKVHNAAIRGNTDRFVFRFKKARRG